MRQLIARIDDELHARLRAEAAAQGRSVNSLVTETLENALGLSSTKQGVRERARASGRLVTPPMPKNPPSRARMLRANRGSGTALSEALAAERSEQ